MVETEDDHWKRITPDGVRPLVDGCTVFEVDPDQLSPAVQKMLEHLHKPSPPAFITVTAADGKLEAMINPDHITIAIPAEDDPSKSDISIIDRAYPLTVDYSLEELRGLIEESRKT